MFDTSVPVVALFRGGYGDVSIARTLGRLGVPMYLVAQRDLSTAVWSSRYWSKRERWDFTKSEKQSVAFLLEFGGALQKTHGARAVLLTTSDWVAIFIERNRHVLEQQFMFPQPVRPVVRKLANKWEAHLLAKEHAVPTPVTRRPTSRVEVEEFIEISGFPVVMKGADPYLKHLPSKRIVYSRQELMKEMDREAGRTPMNLILQEYIPGDADSVWMCNGYFGRKANYTVIFTGKKLRQVSPTGIASLAICLPNETVAVQTRRFMEAVGYRGCFGIGFRYDRRDGLYKLLDVNARVSAIFRLFTGTNCMDVVRACYLDLTDQEPPVTSLQPGRKWMREDDVVAALAAVRSGRLSFTEWKRSMLGVQELHWFARDDLAPIVAWTSQQIRARARFKRRTTTR
jgi:D-aspartate ligase